MCHSYELLRSLRLIRRLAISKEGQDVLCVATTTASQIYIIQHSKQTYLGDMDRTIAQARGSTHTLLPSSCAKTAIHRHVPAAS
ncbi:hypothetical protein AcW2_000745 [Taiwanofungus camphoratus]|nr:hypothetical protein AcW2_000745 [Antrodia cinnamomea]